MHPKTQNSKEFDTKKDRFHGLLKMVGPERLELSHIAALDPKSSASTNFATGPCL